jgi:intein/homing endonuclease
VKKKKYVNRRIVVSYGEPKWKKANELKINDYFGMVINTDEIIPELMIYRLINRNTNTIINETFKLDKPEYWWMMGYFIGDGWLEEDKKNDGRLRHTIKFSINNNDENEILERIQKVIPIVDKKSDSGKCKKFGCHNYIWFQILQQFGKYAHGKIIPEWVHKAPKEFINEFINGYIKADGNMTKNGIQKGTIQITTVSYNLAYGVQRLLLKLG